MIHCLNDLFVLKLCKNVDDIGFKQKARELILLSEGLEKAVDEASRFCNDLAVALGIDCLLCFLM